MTGLLLFSRIVDFINERVGKITAWAVLAAVLVSANNAIIRKVFDTSSNAWLELQWYLFGAVFMLCASWTLQVNGHIRIDVIYNNLSRRTRNFIELGGHLFFLLPFVMLMIYLSLPFFVRSFQSGEVSANAGGLLIWPAKGMILLGFILLGLQGLSELIKRIAIMRGDLNDEHAPSDHDAAAEAERLIRELADTDAPGKQSGEIAR